MILNNGELWLRKSCRFDLLLDSSNGNGAAWKCEVSPSEYPPAQIVTFPADRILYGLSGRGELVAEDGAKCVLGPGAIVRIRGGSKCVMRNELRDVFRFLCILDGATGAENFIDALAFTADESELEAQAAAVGCELYLPPREPEIPAVIKALEQRISYPMRASFSL
jgi:hypothetical protein